MTEETNQNTPEQAPTGKTAGENAPPSTVEEQAPTVVSENLHSTSEPQTTDIPSANAPDPATANPETNPNAAKPAAKASSPNVAKAEAGVKAAKAEAGDKPAAAVKAKKEKAPALEDKPFVEFMQQDYVPALKKALEAQGIKELTLAFEKQKIPVRGMEQDECWQVKGIWQNGLRQFNLYFPDEDIQGKKGFSCNEGKKPSTLESFLIDERRVNLDLLVFGAIQRLNGQKWLTLN